MIRDRPMWVDTAMMAVRSPWPHVVWAALTIVHYTSLTIFLPLVKLELSWLAGWFYVLAALGLLSKETHGLLTLTVLPIPLQLHLAWLAVCVALYSRYGGLDRATVPRPAPIGWYRVYVERVVGAEWVTAFTMTVLLNGLFATLAAICIALRLLGGPRSTTGAADEWEAGVGDSITFGLLLVSVLAPWTLLTWGILLLEARRFACRRFGARVRS